MADLQSMPLESKEALTQLFKDTEELLAVPMRILCNLIGMLGKPKDGERPFTLTVAF